jgi:dynactin complex subunit
MTNQDLFHRTAEKVLAQGLNAMTIACDSLTLANTALNEEVERLQAEVERLKHRLVTDSIEKE